MKMFNIIKKACSRGRRQITSTQKGGCLTWMLRLTKIGRHPVKINNDIETACWRIESDKHLIQISEKLENHIDKSKVTSEAKMINFVYNVLRHETEHGIQSTEVSKVADQLSSLGIPFALLNLFEDARIEYNAATRPESEGGFGAFRWVNFEPDVDASTSQPTTAFYALKQREAGIKKCQSAYLPKWLGIADVMYQGRKKKTHLVILDFYRRAIAAKKMISLIPILQEWVELFGIDVDMPRSDSTIGGRVDPKVQNISEVEQDAGASKSEKENEPSKIEGIDQWVVSDPQSDYPIDDALVDRIQRAMMQLIKKGSTNRVDRGMSGTHLDVSKAMTGATDVFRRRGDAKGRRSMTLVIDWSGSMVRKWSSEGGKELFLAMRKLHRIGVIDLDVIFTRDNQSLSSMGANSVLKKDASEKTDRAIAMSQPNGSREFVLASIKANEQLIRKSKSVVIFTDGKLHDSKADLSQFKSMGVKAIASVVEANEYVIPKMRAKMNQFFSRSLVATHATELARLIVKEVLKNA